MRGSWSTPSDSSVVAAWVIVGQSDWLPMIMATAGFLERPGGSAFRTRVVMRGFAMIAPSAGQWPKKRSGGL